MISAFRALKYRNFRLFFPGLLIAQIGIWAQNVAICWLVYDITKSPFVMGTILFFSALPLFIVAPFGGVIIDKFDRHKLLKIIQNLYAIQALIMTIIAFSGHIHIWNIALLGIFLNIIAAIDGPLRQSMYILLVEDKHDLNNAIALNSTCFNAARIIGPAIAGLLLSTVGTGFCFLINFLFLIPVNILVMLMKINEVKDEKLQSETVLEGLKEGVEYFLKTPKIEFLLIYLALFSFFGMTYPMLMPIYTVQVLNQNADIMGILMSIAGIGAISGSLFLASKSSIKGLKEFLAFAAFLLGFGFILLGITSVKSITFFAMFIIGLGSIGTLTSINTLIQSVVNDDKRGRVMSIHSICYMGTLSVSNFFAGSFTHALGISTAFICLGIFIILMCLYFYIKLKNISYI